MAYVECIVEDGLRPSEVSVGVQDMDGRRIYLRVERDFVQKNHLLPIGIVYKDFPRKRALIELPHEADNGDNRLWVSEDQLKESKEN